MLSLNRFDHIYIYRPFIDFRKDIHGFSVFVQEELKLDSFGNYLFLFYNRGKNRLKALCWDQTEFVLWYKYLEKESYYWPYHLEEDLVVVDVEKINQFLLGFNPCKFLIKKLSFFSV